MKKYVVSVLVALVICIALLAGCAGCNSSEGKEMENLHKEVANLTKERDEAREIAKRPENAVRKVMAEKEADIRALEARTVLLQKEIEEGPMKAVYEALTKILKKEEEREKEIKSLKEEIAKLSERRSADVKKVTDAAESLRKAQEELAEAERGRASFLAKILFTAIPSKRERELIELQHENMLSVTKSKAMDVAEKNTQVVKVLGSQ